MRMLHTDLNGINTVDDAVRYWSERHEVEEAAAAQAEAHWTVTHPPNVVVDRSAKMKWLIEQGKLKPDDPGAQQMDQLSAWCRRNGMEALEGWTQEMIDDADAEEQAAAAAAEEPPADEPPKAAEQP